MYVVLSRKVFSVYILFISVLLKLDIVSHKSPNDWSLHILACILYYNYEILFLMYKRVRHK